MESYSKKFKPGRSTGFTLAEVLMAALVMGVGLTAIMGALRSGTQVNTYATDVSQAVFLAQELRECTAHLSFSDPDSEQQDNPPGLDEASISLADDLDDYNHQAFSPPVSSIGDSLTDMSRWSQAIDITWKDDNDIATNVSDGASDTAYVKVTIRHDGQVVLTTGWIVSRQLAN